MLTVKLLYKLSNVPDDLNLDYKHTRDTIYTHFQGTTNNTYGFGNTFLAPSFFLPVHHISTSIFVFTRPNDGWTGLSIKLYPDRTTMP